jgi:hypothetical protein
MEEAKRPVEDDEANLPAAILLDPLAETTHKVRDRLLISSLLLLASSIATGRDISAFGFKFEQADFPLVRLFLLITASYFAIDFLFLVTRDFIYKRYQVEPEVRRGFTLLRQSWLEEQSLLLKKIGYLKLLEQMKEVKSKLDQLDPEDMVPLAREGEPVDEVNLLRERRDQLLKEYDALDYLGEEHKHIEKWGQKGKLGRMIRLFWIMSNLKTWLLWVEIVPPILLFCLSVAAYCLWHHQAAASLLHLIQSLFAWCRTSPL